MPENKELRFTFVVDPGAMQKAKADIQTVLVDLKKIGEATSHTGMAGLTTGSASQSPESMRTAAAGAAPAAGQGLAGGVSGIAQNLKTVSQASIEEFRKMVLATRDGVSSQKRDLDALKASALGAAEALKGMYGAGGSRVPFRAREATGFTGFYRAGAGPVQRALAGIPDLEDEPVGPNRPLLVRGPGGGGKPPKPPGDSEKEEEEGGGLTKKDIRNAKALGASYVAQRLASGFTSLTETIQGEAFATVSNEARRAQAMGRFGVNIQQGDVSSIAALMQIRGDSAKREEFNRLGQQGNLKFAADVTKDAVSGFFGLDPGLIYKATNNLKAGIGSMVGGESPAELANIQAEMSENQAKFIQQQTQTDPDFYYKLNKFTGSAAGRVNQMRRFGVGSKDLGRIRSGLMESGFSEAEGEAAFGALQGQIGRKGALQNMTEVLRGTASGMDMGTASSLVSASAMGGGSLMNQVFNMRVVGVDRVAAETLGVASAKAAMSSGNITAMSGDALMRGLGHFGFQGKGHEKEDMFLSQAVIQGIPTATSILGGTFDAFSRGTTMMNAISATRNPATGANAPVHVQEYLAKVGRDPVMVADIMAGKLPQSLADRGITLKQAQGFLSAQNRSFFNAHTLIQEGDTTVTGTAMSELIKDYKGDPTAMMRGKLAELKRSGLKGAKLKAAVLREGEKLGEAFTDIGATETDRAGLAAAMANTGMMSAGEADKALGKIKGFDAAAKSPEEAFVKTMGEFEKKFENWVQDNQTKLSSIIQGMTTAAGKFNSLGQMATSADAASEALLSLAEAAAATVQAGGGHVVFDESTGAAITAHTARRAQQVATAKKEQKEKQFKEHGKKIIQLREKARYGGNLPGPVERARKEAYRRGFGEAYDDTSIK